MVGHGGLVVQSLSYRPDSGGVGRRGSSFWRRVDDRPAGVGEDSRLFEECFDAADSLGGEAPVLLVLVILFLALIETESTMLLLQL